MNKKILMLAITVLSVSLIVGFIAISYNSKLLTEQGNVHVSFTLGSVHSKIIIQNGKGEVVLNEYHAGAVTKLGLNLTLAKLTGNSTAYNMTQYPMNLTYVGIGNQGTLSTDSTVLPGEWNRTAADTLHDATYNACNWTLVIHPGTGPYTADCLGVYFDDNEDSLFLYDTFSEVSGIDNTFTITLEIKLSAS